MSLATATLAQTVPSYVPKNGLVGWWPFNGNANDESGNGNNGTVNGATLTSDRFGDTGKAYSFDGLTNYIEVSDNNTLDLVTQFSLFGWFKTNNLTKLLQTIISKPRNLNGTGYNLTYDFQLMGSFCNNNNINTGVFFDPPTDSSWHLAIATYDGSTFNLFFDNVLVDTKNEVFTLINSNQNLFFGMENSLLGRFFSGKLDDIGIWNRALTQQEITDLYNAVNCNNNLAITPQTNTLQIGKTAKFTATTSDANPSYVWQSDFGQGFQTLNNYGNYSGVNTATLNVANVKLANHNQAIRAISTSGNCADTSNVAFINIADTCVNTITNTVTITDTTFISVIDTLFIDIKTVGLNNNPVSNIIKAFPNPAHSHLNLNFGNYANLNGYSVKIINSLSQIIYNQVISKQTETIDLTTFGGSGIYYLHILNSQGKSIEVKKIVLE